MEQIIQQFLEAQQVLTDFISNKANFSLIEKAGETIVDSLKKGGKIMSCGNGGSMADAMHFAEELSGRFRDERPAIAAISLSDPTHLTCVSNDYGFDHVFSRYVEAIGSCNDILLAISTSGNSANIVNAALVAQKKGIKIISLTGKKGGKLAELSDVEIRVPHMGYSDRIQEIHIKIIHTLILYIEKHYA